MMSKRRSLNVRARPRTQKRDAVKKRLDDSSNSSAGSNSFLSLQENFFGLNLSSPRSAPTPLRGLISLRGTPFHKLGE